MAPHGTVQTTGAGNGNGVAVKLEPFNGWMNDQGFDGSIEQHTPIELSVTGNIPTYAAGTLYRTGPGGYKLKTNNGTELAMSHWFDGFSKVHRFKLQPNDDSSNTRVFYNSRSICDDHLENMRKSNDFAGFSFGNKRDPCESFFKKAQSSFKAALDDRTSTRSSANIGVTVSINMPGNPTGLKSSTVDKSKAIQTLHTKTDSVIMEALDPETLEPLGIAKQTSLHPDLKGPLSAAHAKSDPVTGDIFNFNLNFGMQSEYKVFRVSAATGKTDILATIPDVPAYLHSMFLTADHVILCVWNSHLAKGGASIMWHRNVLDAISPFDESKPARWHVIDRKNGKGLLATYETPAFYSFHTVNAWTEESKTEPGKIDIICDLAAYVNLDVAKKFYYENIKSTAPGSDAYRGERGDTSRPLYRRYRLPDVPSEPSKGAKLGTIEFTSQMAQGMELPVLNGKYITKPHRYTYGIVDRGLSTFMDGLVKFDSETKSHIYWEEQGATPGEPIFVADPNGTSEDDGVILSVVLDGNSGKSYLVCLDAKTMTEVGKAQVEGVVGFGFHGAHVTERGEANDF
ncbi:carotenoid oxygenase [Rhizodiscina lignyota]|uniref:Carotenoid oxygenase n=1 Tax=Rhizodiscina lignyota TaxID=1504668 RepID=A0A9P4MBF1_9PEZI|nr:carotenoid oxygenase [Rhizodiscina lignyota]